MSKEIYLNYINKLHSNINAKTGLIQVLLGPRQVGKTTTVLKLLDEHYKDKAHYVSADQVFNSDTSWLRENWQRARSENKMLVVDEIQKCHNWAEAIKSLYDDSKRHKTPVTCVLLGSSSLEIQKGLSESLTGRFQLVQAYHWNFRESVEGYGLSFDTYLHYGGYPGSYQFINSDDWVAYVKNSIVATVVEKDILQYNTVKNPALFKQAFELLISYPAQEISYTKLLGQLQERGNVELVKHYISLYEGAYLIRALEKFSNKATLTKGSSPKIIPLAPCLPYLQSRIPYDKDQRGRIFELLVGIQLVRTDEELYYWRAGTFEVDYVLKQGGHIWAIEVKSNRKKSRKGLDEFKKNFPNSRTCILDIESYSEFEEDPIWFLHTHAL